MNSWHAFSPWWSLVPVGAFFAYGMMKSNYEQYRQLESTLNQTIAGLRQENESLKQQLTPPEVSPEEKRRRAIVTEKIGSFSQEQKMVLRYIMECGPVKHIELQLLTRFNSADVQQAIVQGNLSGLIVWSGDEVSVKSEFQSALNFVLSSEGI